MPLDFETGTEVPYKNHNFKYFLPYDYRPIKIQTNQIDSEEGLFEALRDFCPIVLSWFEEEIRVEFLLL